MNFPPSKPRLYMHRVSFNVYFTYCEYTEKNIICNKTIHINIESRLMNIDGPILIPTGMPTQVYNCLIALYRLVFVSVVYRLYQEQA